MSRKSVLIVDEDPEWAETVLGFELEEMGYTVRIAPDCKSARRELEDHNFSLVTVDMCLEEDRGTWEGSYVLEHVRERYRHIPCVVISGSSCPPGAIFDMSRRYPMIPDGGYLSKERFSLREFKDLVNRVLHARDDKSAPGGVVPGSRKDLDAPVNSAPQGEVP